MRVLLYDSTADSLLPSFLLLYGSSLDRVPVVDRQPFRFADGEVDSPYTSLRYVYSLCICTRSTFVSGLRVCVCELIIDCECVMYKRQDSSLHDECTDTQ
eukprot:GHVU01148949.1.p1 GENE.GHVU01148949.1~~GHVU01148949.1.p1  ORF type:complete len:100 (-),score=1.88 GHVU01148949.1:797-1096(-)